MKETSYSLRQILNIEQFKNICIQFTKITGMSVKITDFTDQEEIFSIGNRAATDYLLKYTDDFIKSCNHCNNSLTDIKNISELLEKPKINQCKFGFYCVQAPIMVNDFPIGFISLGHVFLESPDLTLFEAIAEKHNIEKEDFIKSIKEIPVTTERVLLQSILLMSAIAQALSDPAIKKAELKERSNFVELHEAALSHIPDMVWFKDLEYKYVFVNEAYRQILNRPLSEIIGFTDLELQPNKQLAKKYAHDDQTVFQTGKRIRIEELFEEPDGKTRYIEVYKTPVFNDNNVIIGAIGIGRNISDRVKLQQKLTAQNEILTEKEKTLEFQNVQLKEKEEQLTEQYNELQDLQEELRKMLVKEEEANKDLSNANVKKDKFLSIMSHEIRTPLNSIIGFSELLRTGYFGELNERQIEYLTLIQNSSEHLITLISDILDISKIDAGNYDLKLTHFMIDEFLAELVKLMEPQFKNKGIKLTHTRLERDISLTGDLVKYKQILLNLLSNALKYTNSKGHVEIKAEREYDNNIKISVIDNGIGISEENQDRIFNEFYQIRNEKEEMLIGAGIGLTLTKKLVELHNGSIHLESELDKGSTFWVVMPISID